MGELPLLPELPGPEPETCAECFCENGIAATGPDCQESGIKCVSCDDGHTEYTYNGQMRCGEKKPCTCENGTAAEGVDCEEARQLGDDGDVCNICNKGYVMNWSTSTCNPEPLPDCKCFGGIPYKGGDKVMSVVDGERVETFPCNVAGKNACLGCKQGWVLDDGGNNFCKPKDDNCEVSFYQGANYTGKVCHVSWEHNMYWQSQGGVGYYRSEIDDIESFDSYNEEMCAWMRQSGIGSIKRDYQVPQDGTRPHGCQLRIRTDSDELLKECNQATACKEDKESTECKKCKYTKASDPPTMGTKFQIVDTNQEFPDLKNDDSFVVNKLIGTKPTRVMREYINQPH